MLENDSERGMKTSAYYDDLIYAAVDVIKKSLYDLRESRIKGVSVHNPTLGNLCCNLMACYPPGSLSRPVFNLEYVEVTLDTTKAEILRILPYLLISYIFNYSTNETMREKIPYNEPNFRKGYKAPTYSVDRLMMYEDNQPWGYDADHIIRDRNNYKRAVLRQARQFTLLPWTNARKKGLAELEHHFDEMNQHSNAFDCAELLWKVHIISKVIVLTEEIPTYSSKISYKDSMDLILCHFPFHRFKMLGAIWDLVQPPSFPVAPDYAPIIFSRYYLEKITSETISDLDIYGNSLDSIFYRLYPKAPLFPDGR